MKETNCVSFCALGATLLAIVLSALPARADILHGLGNTGDGGGSNPLEFTFPGILQTHRGLNWGGAGLPYNFSQVGASSASVLTPGGQVDQLVAQVEAGNVTLALMWVGDNDWFSTAGPIAEGIVTGAALATFQQGVADNIATGANRVLAAGGHVVLGGFSNVANAPAAAALYADPVKRERLETALATADDMLIDYAASQGIPFIDFFRLQKSVFDAGSFNVGGVNILVNGVGADPHNFWADALNTNIVIKGVITNLWIHAINQGYGTDIPYLTDLEVLTLAGLQQEYLGETLLPTLDLDEFVRIVPEPSTALLAALGLAALAFCSARAKHAR